MRGINQRYSSSAETDSSGGYMYILKGLIFTFILSFILLFIVSVIFNMSYPKDNIINLFVYTVCALSNLFFGFYISRHFSKSGLLKGALSGLLYFFVLFILGSVISRNMSFNLLKTLSFFLSVIGGALGGIIGMNTKKDYRRH